MEYMFTFTFEGDKILSIVEFIDPNVVDAFLSNETIAQEACPIR